MSDDLIPEIARRVKADGRTETAVPFLTLLKQSRPTPITRGVIEPSLCAVVQGGKRLHVGRDTYDYRAPSYAMSAVEYPTSGRVIEASPRTPYLALRISFDCGEIAQVVIDAGLSLEVDERGPKPGVFVDVADAATTDCFLRLVRIADEPDPLFLAQNIRRELVYRLLRGPHGPRIYRTVQVSSAGVRRAIEWLRRHFDEPIDIEALAKSCKMSVSSLRHEFKAATALAPLQYQKQLRLQEARRLLVAGAVDAGGAAFRVGYESPSQFSREYRRLFGAPPMQHVRGNHRDQFEPGVVT